MLKSYEQMRDGGLRDMKSETTHMEALRLFARSPDERRALEVFAEWAFTQGMGAVLKNIDQALTRKPAA